VARCSPAKAGVQEREALRLLRSAQATLLRSVLGPGLRRGTAEAAMKPINPFPYIAMLIVVVFLYLWLNGYLV